MRTGELDEIKCYCLQYFLLLFFALFSWNSKQQCFYNRWGTGGKNLLNKNVIITTTPIQSIFWIPNILIQVKHRHTYIRTYFLIPGFTLTKTSRKAKKDVMIYCWFMMTALKKTLPEPIFWSVQNIGTMKISQLAMDYHPLTSNSMLGESMAFFWKAVRGAIMKEDTGKKSHGYSQADQC